MAEEKALPISDPQLRRRLRRRCLFDSLQDQIAVEIPGSVRSGGVLAFAEQVVEAASVARLAYDLHEMRRSYL